MSRKQPPFSFPVESADIYVRMSPAEIALIQKAAAFEHRSVSQWCRLALVKLAEGYKHLPPEAD